MSHPQLPSQEHKRFTLWISTSGKQLRRKKINNQKKKKESPGGIPAADRLEALQSGLWRLPPAVTFLSSSSWLRCTAVDEGV